MAGTETHRNSFLFFIHLLFFVFVPVLREIPSKAFDMLSKTSSFHSLSSEKLMSSGNKEIIEDFIRKVKLHIPEGSITSLDPYFVFLLFVLLEMRKEIK